MENRDVEKEITKLGALDIQSQLQAINSLLQHVSYTHVKITNSIWPYTLSSATSCPTMGLFNNYRVQNRSKVLYLYKRKSNLDLIDV